MGIFTRFRDIISANINSMLDEAEDPEKMLKLMIREMEGTRSRADYWRAKAALAVSKGRDDLARDALIEKRRYTEKAEGLQRELKEHQVLVAQYQDDMVQLEHKLSGAREKQRTLVQRHIHAQRQRQAQEESQGF